MLDEANTRSERLLYLGGVSCRATAVEIHTFWNRLTMTKSFHTQPSWYEDYHIETDVEIHLSIFNPTNRRWARSLGMWGATGALVFA